LLVHASRIGVLFWVIVGFLCAYRALAVLTSPLSAAAALFLTWLGTSALAYTWRDLNMSHAISLSFISIAYYLAIKSTAASRPNRYAILMGLASGMVIATRFVNLILILPALGLWFTTLARPASPAHSGPAPTGSFLSALALRPRLARQVLPSLALVFFAMLPPLILQIAVWKQVYGSWLFNGYSGEGFSFNPANIAHLLLSSRHGLFFWHPLTIVCLAGLAFGCGQWRRNRLTASFVAGCTAALVIMILLYGSWSTWSLGWSYGARWAADPFFLWALGLAVLMWKFLPAGNVKRFAFLLFPASISALLLTAQFAHLLPRDDYLHIHMPGGQVHQIP
jgi:hypothetical protein